jgi:hypothetical protein
VFTVEVAGGDAPRGFLPGRVAPPPADDEGDAAVVAAAPLTVSGAEALRLRTDACGRVLLPPASAAKTDGSGAPEPAAAWVGVPV